MTTDTIATAPSAAPSLVHALLLAGDYAEASNAAEDALAAAGAAPQRAALLLDWVRASTAMGNLEGAEDRLGEALALLPPDAEDALALDIRLELARIYVLQGNLRQGQAMSQELGEQAAQAGWPPLVARASSISGWSLMRMRRFTEAVAALAPAREFYLAHPEHYGAAQSEHWYAWSMIGAGEIEEGLRIAEAQLAALDVTEPNPYTLSTVLNTLTYGEFCRGNLRRVAELSQGKLEVEMQLGSKPRIQIMHHNMGLLAIQLGDFATARDRLLRCWALTQELPDQRFSVEVAKLLSIVALHDGEPAQALEYAQLGHERLRSLGLESEQTYEWYLALAFLGTGYCAMAVEAWDRRRPYEPSLENWLELQMLRAVLDRIAMPDFPCPPEASAEVAALSARWLGELLTEQRRMPRPAAVASGDLHGVIDSGGQEDVGAGEAIHG